MGLDVYLEDQAKPEPHYPDHDALCKELGIPTHHKDQTEEAHKLLSDERGKRQDAIDKSFASKLHPKHGSNRRYLRSSYNSGGFNHVVQNLTGKDLYYIFQPPESYEWEPTAEELHLARKRAEEVRDELANATDLRVATESAVNLFTGQSAVTEERVLDIVREELGREHSFGSYSNAQGAFFLKDPLPVIAMIPGVDTFGKPAIHAVWRPSDEDTAYYREMADIVIEFIDEALSMERPQVSWSS